ncbi:MAG: phosphate uptake regulator PhoU [Nitrososphaerota archaeon]|jgi:phosphate uptake regulator|nr:phosphate uptake regulator PhoU [Nitrososphaerota archaeon]
MRDLRKVQQTPTGTFFVCVPKTWAQQYGLKKGALVNLEVTDDGKLVVDAKYGSEPQQRMIILTVGPFLRREIIGCYLLGFDVICVEAKDRIELEVRNIVKSTVSSLVGLEIVEETYSQVVLQCLLDPLGSQPEKILRRIYAIVSGMVRDVTNSFITGDLQLAKAVVARDVESNRLYFLLVRTLRTIIQTPSLSEKLGITSIDCLDYRLAASLIESMGDVCVQIATKTLELHGFKPYGELLKLLIDLQTVCLEANGQALKAFINKDMEIAENVRNVKTTIRNISVDIEKVAKNQPIDVMPHILVTTSFIRQIYEHSLDMADLVA